MKKTKKYLLAFIFIFAIGFVIVMQSTNNSVNASALAGGKITVIGSGEKHYTPDTAIVVLGVETIDASVLTAQQENTVVMDKIIVALKENNIEETNIKTTNYTIREKYDYFNNKGLIGNQVCNYIEFKTKNIDDLGTLLTTVAQEGANVVRNINFVLEDHTTAYTEVLGLAIENAKQKANVLSNNSNIDVVEIIEESCYNSLRGFDSFVLAKETQNTNYNNISKGEIKICANVKVIYEIA